MRGGVDYLGQAIVSADALSLSERYSATQQLALSLTQEARVFADGDQAALDAVRGDIFAILDQGLAAAIHNANPETIAKKTTPISLPTVSTFGELRANTDAFLAALTDIGERALRLLTGSSEAAAADVERDLHDIREVIQDSSQSVVLGQGHYRNPFDVNDFDPDAAPISVGALAEGAIRTFTVYTPYAAGAGGQNIKLTLSGVTADKLVVLDHSNDIGVGPDGVFALTLPEGRRELSFTLWAKQDIDADATLELSAQLVDSAGEPTHRDRVELNLQLHADDESRPQTVLEIRGDWAPKPHTNPDTGEIYYRQDALGNVERLSGVSNSTGYGEWDQKLDGSSGPDHIVTGDYEDTAYGYEGDDAITGSDRRGSVFFGGAGNDWIEALDYTGHVTDYYEREYLGRTIRLGEDKLYGGAGDDRIYGGAETTVDALEDSSIAPTNLPGDWSSGGSGKDQVFGGAGDDVLMGGSGEDLLVGGPGMDVLLGDDHFLLRPDGNLWRVLHPNFGDATAGLGGFEVGLFPVVNAALAFPDSVFPQTGDPDFTYYKNGGAADVLIGGAGRDILIGQAGNDTLHGGDDDDVLAGWEGDDELLGGRGNDLIAGDFGRYEQTDQRLMPGVAVAIAGVVGSSSSLGGTVDLLGNDLIDGGAGDDTLFGEGGDDAVLGGDGADTLYGDAVYLPDALHGNDILDGGDGDDKLYGNGGADRLFGAAGADALFGGSGNDFIDAGAGDDTLSGEEGNDTLLGGDGADVMYGGAGVDDLRAGAGDDLLDGGGGDDVMFGETGADQVRGGAGNDRLYGGAGEDIIEGGDGDDLIDGGDGIDIVRGGAGDDTYVLGFGYGRDIIEDDEGSNRIQFGSSIYAQDLQVDLDSETLLATLTYSAIDDSVSVDINALQIDAFEFADGASWTRTQFVNVLPALIRDGSGGDETLEANPNLKNDLHGHGGDDSLFGGGYADVLEGGSGSDLIDGRGGGDTYFFTSSEIGVDLILDSASEALGYFGWYYGDLGVDAWRQRAAYGGKYHVAQSGEGGALDVYYESYEEALLDNPTLAIDFVEPLPSVAPLVQRDDDLAIEELIVMGIVPRDVVSFGSSISVADLVITVNVSGASADAHPTQPWHDGGTLSVRWNDGEAGFDLEIPDVNYGLVGADLFAQIGEDDNGEPLYAWQTYRLGEGVESFRFADGSEYSLEEMLAQATVVPEYGEFYFQRGAGPQVISRFSAAIVFEPGISYGELGITRDGLDLLLTLSDGSAQGRLLDWYADPQVRPGLELQFGDGVVVDAEELSWQGLFVLGTEGDDVLIGIDGFGDSLDADLGDDVVDGGSGDDDAFGGEGNDIVRGGPGEDDVEVWGEGSNFLDAGPSDDFVYTEGHALVIGGEGDDWIGFYGDAGIAAFNPGDGNDTVYVAGTLTLSLGGGIGADDLELSLVEADGPGVDNLLLSLGEDDSILLTRQWEDDPAAWPETTLQLFGSVHRFNFNAIVDALLGQSGGEPGFVLQFGDLLETARIGFSETEGIGGALAWQYATTGSTAMLSDDVIRALLAEPAFGAAPQPIQLAQANRAPEVVKAITDQSALEDALFELSVADAFADSDAGDNLSYGAVLSDGTALPGWLDFETAGGTFIGTPSNDDVGALQITVSAADNEGESAESTFVLEVLNVNDAPMLLEPILPQSGRVGEALAFSIDGGFADIDAGDNLAYGATLADGSALPDWLVFDADAASFAGTPGAGDAGSYTIRITATDRAGESADAEIALAVAAAPSDDPGGHGGTPGGWPHGHDHDHHPGHGKGRDEHHEKHARHEHGKRRDADRSHDGSHAWQKKSPKFDFHALLDDFERGERYEARSQADIRHGWQQVARYSAHLGAGDDDIAHGLLWRGAKDLAWLAPGGGQGFGFEGSTGAARRAGEFKCFEGLREGFRRL